MTDSTKGNPQDLAPDDKNRFFDRPLDTYSKQFLVKLIESYRGHVRRLEKSNEELGLALHKCMHPEGIKGWD